MSMSSAAGSHAKTSALPEKAQGSPEQGPVFGTSSLGSLASYDPNTLSWRTSQLSLLEEWTPFSGRFPRSGMTRSGTLFQLQPLVRHTAVSGSGSLPTPTTKANQMCPSMMSRGVACRNLREAMFPTPSASGMPCEGTVRLARKAWLDGAATLEEANAIAGRDVRDAQGKVPAMWPTPTACQGHNNSAMNSGSGGRELLQKAAASPEEASQMAGGRLNPTWVEWLMGFPLGWTDLGDLATRSSRKSSK